MMIDSYTSFYSFWSCHSFCPPGLAMSTGSSYHHPFKQPVDSRIAFAQRLCCDQHLCCVVSQPKMIIRMINIQNVTLIEFGTSSSTWFQNTLDETWFENELIEICRYHKLSHFDLCPTKDSSVFSLIWSTHCGKLWSTKVYNTSMS